jgi:hypothetical protein
MRRTAWAAAVVIGLSAVASIGADPTAAAQRDHEIKLIGAPALSDSNVGAGNGKHHFNAIVQVKSSIPDMQNLTVEFEVMQGASCCGRRRRPLVSGPAEGSSRRTSSSRRRARTR